MNFFHRDFAHSVWPHFWALMCLPAVALVSSTWACICNMGEQCSIKSRATIRVPCEELMPGWRNESAVWGWLSGILFLFFLLFFLPPYLFSSFLIASSSLPLPLLSSLSFLFLLFFNLFSSLPTSPSLFSPLFPSLSLSSSFLERFLLCSLGWSWTCNPASLLCTVFLVYTTMSYSGGFFAPKYIGLKTNSCFILAVCFSSKKSQRQDG